MRISSARRKKACLSGRIHPAGITRMFFRMPVGIIWNGLEADAGGGFRDKKARSGERVESGSRRLARQSFEPSMPPYTTFALHSGSSQFFQLEGSLPSANGTIEWE